MTQGVSPNQPASTYWVRTSSIEQRMDRSDPKYPSDGRLRRSERTRHALIKAYLDLLREKQQPPTAPEIARRAGCSIRSVFQHFSSLLTLSLAAADHAFAQALAPGCGPKCRC